MSSAQNASRSPDPRSERSSAALAEAMMRLARETPLNELTITRLVQEAQVTRPTFYQHCNGIQDLAQRVALANLDRAIPENAAPEATATDGAQLSAHVASHVCAALDHLEENRAFYLNVLDHAGSVEFFEGIIRLLTAKMVADAFAALRRADPEAAEDLMQVLAGGVMWLVIGWLRSEAPKDTPAAMSRRIGQTVATLLLSAGASARV
ncbi:TetR/AcrR family transcriptional regulator [Pseudooceanicola sp. LIPI14-2-Ac024]|uniref:TetR/AcrR family transcriptional regulator n=1 Tax=Pseudooceanicola sp. LIPI14-2-Ac024 TaxID=3344875 RepID=UPI0035D08933